MYKMYNSQLDEENNDDDSFWSDTEKQDNEDDDKVERATQKEESRPVTEAGASEEEEPELINQEDSRRQSLEDETTDDDDDESFTTSSDSPAPSLMTSGYDTYRPEEQEGGGFRDDRTTTELDQDSRGDLSEMRDGGDDRSLCSFEGFDMEPEACVAGCEDDGQQHKEINLEEERNPTEPGNLADEAPEEKCLVFFAQDESILKEKRLNDMRDPEEAEQQGQGDGEKEAEGAVESEDPDEASSNKGIRFIDSTVDFSWMTYDRMCDEWEGNLRKDAASSLQERLADLHLSTSAQRDFDAESEDVSSQSDAYSTERDGISMSAFESYLQAMTQSIGDLRPKPKSFIRPVMSQQSTRKTDPVAKYFQYKQLWEMFKLPGEKDRRALRWEIREQLAYQPPPPKPRRVYVPNTYIVPTEKKRSSLRWEIRNDLAHGLLPHKFTYRY